mmetsp:Transcript_94075/g.298668  ORF Transcript_94075/g.298668 Transcript_94075/m.298668 type:complete len:339 (-) Transcript_94075:216-1232(-)
MLQLLRPPGESLLEASQMQGRQLDGRLCLGHPLVQLQILLLDLREELLELSVVDLLVVVVVHLPDEVADLFGLYGEGVLPEHLVELLLRDPRVAVLVHLGEGLLDQLLVGLLLLEHERGDELGDVDIQVPVAVELRHDLLDLLRRDPRNLVRNLGELAEGDGPIGVKVHLLEHRFQVPVGIMGQADVRQQPRHGLLDVVLLGEGIELLHGQLADFAVLDLQRLRVCDPRVAQDARRSGAPVPRHAHQPLKKVLEHAGVVGEFEAEGPNGLLDQGGDLLDAPSTEGRPPCAKCEEQRAHRPNVASVTHRRGHGLHLPLEDLGGGVVVLVGLAEAPPRNL